jgi:spatacsin
MMAAKKVSDIAIANHANRELCCHCVAFIEILGVETTRLRATLRCLAMVGGKEPVAFTSAKQLAVMLESVAETASVVDLEAARTFAETFDLPLPQVYLRNLCRQNDWVALLLLAEYLQYPRKQVMAMCRDHFTDACLGMNLWRALKYDSVAVEGGKRKISVSLKRRMSFKAEVSMMFKKPFQVV